MGVSRRTFVQSAAATAAALAPATRLLADSTRETSGIATHHGVAPVPDRFDPWVEVIPANLAHNASALRQLGGSPILAVIKNHGYGLDYRIVARLLEPRPEIEGFALVRADSRHGTRHRREDEGPRGA